MTTLGIFGIIAAALAGLGALLLKLYGNSQRSAGKLEEQNVQRAQESEAKGRADEVLAEHRDPDDAARRLRDGNF